MISIIASVVLAFIIFAASRWAIVLLIHVMTALFQLTTRLIGVIGLFIIVAWMIVLLVQH